MLFDISTNTGLACSGVALFTRPNFKFKSTFANQTPAFDPGPCYEPALV